MSKLAIRDEALAKAAELPGRPAAIEAYWDGDTSGWFVVLAAVLKSGAGYRAAVLVSIEDGGDIRLFNGQAPPWGEARLAQEVGEELAAKFGVPFYFPSPDHPEDDCPRWWEQDQGYPCRRCGIPLLQRDPCPWRGVCYHCHLAEKREAKEASWTPEERAGPRCHICGNPARETAGSALMCQGCLDRYEEYQCSRCGIRVLILKTESHTDMCSRCELRARLDQAPKEHLRAIRRAKEEGGEPAALAMAIKLLRCSLPDALEVVEVLDAEPP